MAQLERAGEWNFTGRAKPVDSKGDETNEPSQATGFVMREKPEYAGSSGAACLVCMNPLSPIDGGCHNAACRKCVQP